MAAKTVDVNLMPGEDLEERPGGKFLKWALSWGKRIVIVTEGIVILAFLSRFWLDTTVADLGEQIISKKNIVEASANFESKFRSTTERITKAKQIDSQVSPLTILDQTRALVPTRVVVTQMAVSGSGVNFSGTADEQSLALLVTAFRKSADFTDLTVERITKTSPSLTIDFSMRATFVKK